LLRFKDNNDDADLDAATNDEDLLAPNADADMDVANSIDDDIYFDAAEDADVDADLDSAVNADEDAVVDPFADADIDTDEFDTKAFSLCAIISFILTSPQKKGIIGKWNVTPI
jgi:hypothetical protein